MLRHTLISAVRTVICGACFAVSAFTRAADNSIPYLVVSGGIRVRFEDPQAQRVVDQRVPVSPPVPPQEIIVFQQEPVTPVPPTLPTPNAHSVLDKPEVESAPAIRAEQFLEFFPVPAEVAEVLKNARARSAAGTAVPGNDASANPNDDGARPESEATAPLA